MQPQNINDLPAIARYIISQYFPELSSYHLTAEFSHVEDSLSEVHHVYPFEDNHYRGQVLLLIDDSMKNSGLTAVIGAIAHDLAHVVAWRGPGNPAVSDKEADNIVVERGLTPYLLEAKRSLEKLRPKFEIKGYSSKELQEMILHS
ncbi:hypothetical protein ACFLVH_02830 [Chloroflexota bacterium]